ncbi:MAG TPA: DNA-binding protein [Clostridiales bacterium UBA8153]|nr:DNA-binding protein [Clostridiales bacterium UBA8153]
MQTLSERLKRVWTVAEVARILDLSESRVYEACRQGLLPHVKIGRQIRVDQKSLEAFLAAGGQALPGGWKRQA